MCDPTSNPMSSSVVCPSVWFVSESVGSRTDLQVRRHEQVWRESVVYVHGVLSSEGRPLRLGLLDWDLRKTPGVRGVDLSLGKGLPLDLRHKGTRGVGKFPRVLGHWEVVG